MDVNKRAALAGYGILSSMAILFVLLSIAETYQHHRLLSFGKIGIVLGIGISAVREWRILSVKALFGRFAMDDLYQIIGCIAGGMLTVSLQLVFGVNSVLASGAVGFAAALWAKKYAPAIFCGSFVGMASTEIFSVFPCIFLSSLFAGILFVITRDVYPGAGGKLGSIAFISCIVTTGLFRHEPLSGIVFGWDVGYQILIFSLAGAIVTYELNLKAGLGPIAASSIIGIISGILLPIFFGNTLGGMFAVTVFCASFAGMSSRERIPSVKSMFPVGIICALLFMYTAPYLDGAGGKLGTIAFAAVLAESGTQELLRDVRMNKRKNSE